MPNTYINILPYKYYIMWWWLSSTLFKKKLNWAKSSWFEIPTIWEQSKSTSSYKNMNECCISCSRSGSISKKFFPSDQNRKITPTESMLCKFINVIWICNNFLFAINIVVTPRLHEKSICTIHENNAGKSTIFIWWCC